MTHELWATLNTKMFEYLSSVTLQDLVDQQKKQTSVIKDLRPGAKSPAELAA
jgi:Rrf2 family iron-sulfur cluster assembly transcriptional regulator